VIVLKMMMIAVLLKKVGMVMNAVRLLMMLMRKMM